MRAFGDRLRLAARVAPIATWSRDAALLLAARVAMSAVRALAGIVVPIYLAELGFSALRLGLVFLIVALVSSMLTTGIGLTADRVGRKPFLIGLPVVTAGAAVAFAATRSAPVLVAAAALGSFGRGAGAGSGVIGPYQPAEQALLADITPAAGRNRLFAVFASGSAAGALVGGALANLTRAGPALGLAGLGAYLPAFLAMAAAALLAGLLAVPVADPTRKAAAKAGRDGRAGGSRPRLPRHSRPLIYKLWATNSVNGLAAGLIGPFITYWFYRRYGAGPAEIGMLFVLINAMAIASNLTAAPFAARFGTVRTIVASRAVQGLLLVPMALAPTFWLAGGIYLVRVLTQRVGLSLRQSYVMGAAHPAERASVAGLSRLPAQLLSALAPALAGFLFDAVSLALPFVLGGGLQVVNAALFHRFFSGAVPDGKGGKGASSSDDTPSRARSGSP